MHIPKTKMEVSKEHFLFNEKPKALINVSNETDALLFDTFHFMMTIYKITRAFHLRSLSRSILIFNFLDLDEITFHTLEFIGGNYPSRKQLFCVC